MASETADIAAPATNPVAPVTVKTPGAEAAILKPSKADRLAAAVAIASGQTPEAKKTGEAKTDPSKTPEESRALKFGAVANREKALRDNVEKAKAELDQRAYKLKEADERVAQLEQAKANAPKDPQAWLKAAGLTYEDLTRHVISGGKLTAEEALAAADKKIEDFKAEQQRQIQELVKKEQEQIEYQKPCRSIAGHPGRPPADDPW